MAIRGKTRGIILVHSVTVGEETAWGAVFMRNEPPASGIPHGADKVLVDTLTRVGRSLEACEARARETATRMGYPAAEVRYAPGTAGVAPAVLDGVEEEAVPSGPGF